VVVEKGSVYCDVRRRDYFVTEVHRNDDDDLDNCLFLGRRGASNCFFFWKDANY